MANPSIVLLLTSPLALLANVASAQSSYCAIKTCNGPDHTLCKFAYLQTDNRCGKVQSSTLTNDEIQQILDTHNRYRAYVASGQETRGNPGPQPAAINLGSLTWDDEIAGIAQTWADQCDYGHDKCRDVPRFGVGQNILSTASTGNYNSNFPELVTAWYDEVAKFDRNQVKSVTKDFENVGHYTQMMWADTTQIGCGVARYNSDDEWNTTYLVCNYGPAGNVVGGEIKDFENVGHYTQMMWADTTQIGCGVARYNSDGEWNTTYLVCNYGPAGNVVGGEMYKTR